MSLAESSVRLDPRSSFAFQMLAYVHAMEGHYEAAMDAAKTAVELNPYDMGARGVLGICHLVIGEHRQAIELFSMAAQRGNSDPRYQWAALNAFSHYLLGQYDASLSWAREALYVNPNHLQVLGDPGGGAGAIGTHRGSGKGGRSSARQLPGPDRRTAFAEFPLENAGRYRALSRRAFEGRHPLQQIDPGRVRRRSSARQMGFTCDGPPASLGLRLTRRRIPPKLSYIAEVVHAPDIRFSEPSFASIERSSLSSFAAFEDLDPCQTIHRHGSEHAVRQIPVSPNNPCPFLRALVAERLCRRPHRAAAEARRNDRDGERRNGR